MTVGEYLEDYEEYFLKHETSLTAKDVLFKELELEIKENVNNTKLITYEEYRAFVREQVRRQNKKCNLLIKLLKKRNPGITCVVKESEFKAWWLARNEDYEGEI